MRKGRKGVLTHRDHRVSFASFALPFWRVTLRSPALQGAGGQGVEAEQVADRAGVARQEAGEPALDRGPVGRAVEMQVQVAGAVVRSGAGGDHALQAFAD